jgi:hypothetical protein
MTTMHILDKSLDWYVQHPDDLRFPLENPEEAYFSKHISIPESPGGGWGYCVSLKGAKKIMRLVKKNIKDHMDQVYIKNVEKRNLNSFAFDPPIIWHEKGAIRPDTDLPWNW